MKCVIMLVGPTCVGKTGASVHLAEALGTEIISADSMQIYRHMDIGTEKPPPELLNRVRHHMIDIVTPVQTYSAGQYLADVVPIIEGLHGRGLTPIVTGGTGLYIKAMTRGLFKGPSADWALRRELKAEQPGELYSRLQALDAETAHGIEPGDTRRVVRALEVCILSGRKMSDVKREGTAPLPYEFIKIGLKRDRAELYGMIEDRVDVMVRRGLIDEVKQVMAMGPSRTPLQAIGYKEVMAHLEGHYPLLEAVRLIKRNTKRYAKRQFTWFNKEPDMRWIDITGQDDPVAVKDMILPLAAYGGQS